MFNFSVLRQALPLRTYATAASSTTKAASSAAAAASKKLAREKAAASKKLANENAAAKNLIKKAEKNIRKISVFSQFLKQNKISARVGADQWKQITQTEKDELKVKADEFNELIKSKFPPKPKRNSTSFANYLASNYDRSISIGENSKKLSTEWKQLSQNEKDSYKTKENENYPKQVADWKELRLKNYKEIFGEK